jgi:hypothetical protein
MKGRNPTLSESLGDYAAYGFALHKPNRRNVKRAKRIRKDAFSKELELKKAA